MGNQAPFNRKSYPTYMVSSLDTAPKLELQNIKFQPSPDNVFEQEIEPLSEMGISIIRNSEFAIVSLPELSSYSRSNVLSFIRDLERYLHYNQVNTEWKIIKYNEGGPFPVHRQKDLDDHTYGGTQFFFPSQSEVPHEGGYLIMNSRLRQYCAGRDSKKWGHLVVNSEATFKVSKVTKGPVFIFMKQIWLKDGFPSIQTDQDRINEQNRYALQRQRRHQQLENERRRQEKVFGKRRR